MGHVPTKALAFAVISKIRYRGRDALAGCNPQRAVAAELAALPEDMQARFVRLADRITSAGLQSLGQPHVKHLEGKLWEMRLAGRDGIARVLYVAAIGQRVVAVRVFVKKTQKTPRAEIELALQRARGSHDHSI